MGEDGATWQLCDMETHRRDGDDKLDSMLEEPGCGLCPTAGAQLATNAPATGLGTFSDVMMHRLLAFYVLLDLPGDCSNCGWILLESCGGPQPKSPPHLDLQPGTQEKIPQIHFCLPLSCAVGLPPWKPGRPVSSGCF